MADINGKRIISTAATPNVYYDITYTKSRPNNNQMRYVFTIKTILENKYSWIGTGHNLTATITVNGSSGSAVIKTRDESWQEAPAGTVRSTDTITITCSSTSTAVQTVTFKVVNTYGSAGVVTNSSYTVAPIAPAPSYTKCGKPSWKTSSGTTFRGTLAGGDGKVTVSWNAGSAGTNNSVTGYIIDAQYPGGDWYEKYNGGTATSATLVFDGYSDRNCDINLRIRTKGSAGASYYSDWSSVIYVRSIASTKCGKPTLNTFSYNKDPATANNDTTFTIQFTRGSSGTNNTANSIEWQYSATGSNVPYLSLGSDTANPSKKTDSWNVRWTGYRVFYRARTIGTAGASYASDWVETPRVLLNPVPPSSVTMTFIGPGTAEMYTAYNSAIGRDVLYFVWDDSHEFQYNVKPAGGAGHTYYELQYAVWHGDQNPTKEDPKAVNWVRDGGEVGTSGLNSYFSSRSHISGRWFQYRARGVHKGGTDSNYGQDETCYSTWVYGPICRFAGSLRFKKDNVWKCGSPFIKVGSTWREVRQIFIKQSGVWKKTE